MTPPKPNWKNRTLFHGDNLKFLRAMNSESVDLIATDPPFNKSRDFHATPDSLAAGASFQDRWSWDKDVHPEWVDQLTDDHPALMEAIESAIHAHSEGMGAYMCFMAVRLLAMRRLLKPTGSIYLHCDQTASHYLKAVMDAIFGNKNFRHQIIWKKTTAHNDARVMGSVHEVILFFSKSEAYKWNKVFTPYEKEYADSRYKHKDADGRRYMDDNLTAKALTGGGYEYEYKGKKSLWRVPIETMQRLDSENRLYFTRTGGIRIKRYLDESKGVPLSNLWTDIHAINSQARERTGYPTQKPAKLYERIINTSSDEGDIVLDPFAGCATTCVAAERLNRQWVGIDIWEKAHEVVVQRLRDEVGLFGEVHYTNDIPARTDEGGTTSPYLQVRLAVKEPEGGKMSRKEMYEVLLSHQGIKCQGCDREFDDPRYLELDHNTPRSDGGLNHISNRILLCGPCNKLKSNTYTLSGLRRQNKKLGYMS